MNLLEMIHPDEVTPKSLMDKVIARLNQRRIPSIHAKGFSMNGLSCIEKRVISIFQEMGCSIMDKQLELLGNNQESLLPVDGRWAESEFP